MGQVRRSAIVSALCLVGALIFGSYAALHLIAGSAAPSGVSGCRRAAPGWTGRTRGPLLPPQRPAVERRVIRLLNAQRSSRHLRPLRLSSALRSAARAHSAQILRSGVFAHGRWEQLLARYSRASCIAENLEWGQLEHARAPGIVAAWMQSPEHHRIVLLSWTRRVGVGIAVGRFQGHPGVSIVTADFAG